MMPVGPGAGCGELTLSVLAVGPRGLGPAAGRGWQRGHSPASCFRDVWRGRQQWGKGAYRPLCKALLHHLPTGKSFNHSLLFELGV